MPDEHDVDEVLVFDQAGDVVDVGAEPDRGAQQVCPVAVAGQRRREHPVPGRLQQRDHPVPASPVVPGAVYQ